MKSKIKNLNQLEDAEQAYYHGTEWSGMSGDALLMHIRAFTGCSHKSVDFKEPMSLKNKATLGKITIKPNY